MPQHKSAKKRVKQNLKKRIINSKIMSKFKSAIKDFEESIQQGNSDESTKLLNKLNKATSKVVKRGIIKKRAASRKISNASKMLKSPN